MAKMLQGGMPVPQGFAISSDVYKEFSPKVPESLQKELLNAFDALGAERVAVRSSAVAEDSADASWAGQLETVLNVTRGGLVDAVEYCWRSIASNRAQSYAKEHNASKANQAVAVVVQAMVDSDISGVMFTANPVTNNKEEMVIEVIYGLGELLVQGVQTPESYVIDGKTGKVIDFSEHHQTKKLVYQNGKNQEVPIDKTGRILDERQINHLVQQAKAIEHYYGQPQDIEFAFSKGKLYIVQSRPITTL